MNVKINKYFLVLLFIISILGILNLITGNSKNQSNMYLNKFDNMYNDFLSVKKTLDLETDNYYKTNNLSKYSVKEIRDKYIKMKSNSQNIVNEVSLLKHDFDGLNGKYIVDIGKDIIKIINNEFLMDNIFDSNDEVIIKQFHKIHNDLKFIFNKYKMLKIAF